MVRGVDRTRRTRGAALASVCTREGCPRKPVAKNLCDAHYRQAKYSRTPRTNPLPVPESVPERFVLRVLGNPAGHECWLWTGRRDRDGYGVFSLRGGQSMRAHRYAWELLRGEIPEELVYDHLCRNRECVNPWHGDLVSGQENTERGGLGFANIERAASRTHCKHGHELTEENVYRPTPTTRVCRSCRREIDARRGSGAKRVLIRTAA